jgi:pimeloyl-ACP methyl ester carboxylesterase
MGGAVISRAAEFRPARVDKLIYVAALLLAEGQTFLDVVPPGTAGPAPSDLIMTEDGIAAFMKPESAQRLFFADCSAEDVALAHTLFMPLGTQKSPRMAVSEKCFGLIPKFYIECTKDQAISLERQRAMQSSVRCRRVVTMETSHSPFLSSPAQLVDHLLKILDA